MPNQTKNLKKKGQKILETMNTKSKYKKEDTRIRNSWNSNFTEKEDGIKEEGVKKVQDTQQARKEEEQKRNDLAGDLGEKIIHTSLKYLLWEDELPEIKEKMAEKKKKALLNCICSTLAHSKVHTLIEVEQDLLVLQMAQYLVEKKVLERNGMFIHTNLKRKEDVQDKIRASINAIKMNLQRFTTNLESCIKFEVTHIKLRTLVDKSLDQAVFKGEVVLTNNFQTVVAEKDTVRNSLFEELKGASPLSVSYDCVPDVNKGTANLRFFTEKKENTVSVLASAIQSSVKRSENEFQVFIDKDKLSENIINAINDLDDSKEESTAKIYREFNLPKRILGKFFPGVEKNPDSNDAVRLHSETQPEFPKEFNHRLIKEIKRHDAKPGSGKKEVLKMEESSESDDEQHLILN